MSDERARAVLERLIEERREDFAGLSRLIGRNPAYIQQYIRRGTPRRLAEEDRRKLARYFGIDEQLLGGPADGAPVEAGELIAVRRFQVTASAGPGAYEASEQAKVDIGFSPEFLAKISSARPRDLSIIRVEGDSMYPTLADGDDIMVDHGAALRRIQDGIYVLRRDDTLLVKRLTVNPVTGRLTIASDNSAHASWNDCDPAEVDVIGRVVWAARKIR